MLLKEITPYQEFNRRRQMWSTTESLDEPVKLAVDPVSFRLNLRDGNLRMAYATELRLMWIPVRVLNFLLD